MKEPQESKVGCRLSFYFCYFIVKCHIEYCPFNIVPNANVIPELNSLYYMFKIRE